jgi:ankyrin repeat protein
VADVQELTPLDEAARYGHEAVINFLINNDTV